MKDFDEGGDEGSDEGDDDGSSEGGNEGGNEGDDEGSDEGSDKGGDKGGNKGEGFCFQTDDQKFVILESLLQLTIIIGRKLHYFLTYGNYDVF